jgi:signal transduction histidine kinase
MLSTSLLIIVVVTNLLLASFVLVNNSRKNLNRILGFLCSTIAIWSIVTFLEDTKVSPTILNILVRFDFLLASLLIMLFFWFCYAITESKYKNLFWVNSAALMLCATLSILGLVVKVNILPDHIEFINQSGYKFFIGYLVLGILGGLIILISKYRHSSGRERNQLQVIFLGCFLTAFFLVLTNVILPNFIQTPPTVTRFGIYSALFLTGSMAYAIIRHGFMDIRLAVTRAITFGLLITLLAAIYAVTFLPVSNLFFTDNKISTGQYALNILLVVILAATFQPLKRTFEKITDNIFYRGGYDSDSLLSNLGEIMAREIDLERLTSNVNSEITNQMKLSKAVIIVLDDDEVFYEANAISNNHRTMSRDELQKIGSGVVVKVLIESNEAKEILDKYDIDVFVDLKSTNELVGYLLLGGKKNGDIFNNTDIKTLNILAHELAIAIHNAKSYTQIQNFNKTLQKRIDDATTQLREANEHLKELDQLKNEFLSMATHQLNTPLTVVDGYLTMVNDGVVSEPAERKDYLEKTLERVRSMKRMVADFLNVSRIETGKFIIEVKPTDINKMISEEVNGLGTSAKTKNVFLQFIPPKHPIPLVEIDEQKTRQAIMNLIDNAIYYTPNGDVKVYLNSDKDTMTFNVVDNGIGVPEKQKEQLFQKFFRADNAKSERPNGNGVGLFLVKRVIEDQGGKIIFESTEGKGSTFGFTLPIKANTSKELTPEPKELVKTAS